MERLIDRIGKTVREHVAESRLTPEQNEIRKYILREFAKNGEAPTAGKITEGLGLPSMDIVIRTIEKLETADILSKSGENIISAYPFSALETRHKVIFGDGHCVYALCATDALGIHFMLNEDIAIVSKCPECGNEIRIVVREGHIDSQNPEDIVEFVSERERGKCTAETHCPFINFFCSGGHVEKWREKNPEYGKGEIYSLNKALEDGKIIFGDFLK